ncbi:HD domain-containing protein [Lacticaseibacillus baoqingensis]|uniref:HD domain-containing protein n=1 Tax=Lacticaseibacillus baoqingensis TaxID=2486013 RepID=A0ABW4E782_9LACO|nr:HD domain-containing protein [Lacticaseibacillus baoqingensis]
MSTKLDWTTDAEYLGYVGDLLAQPAVQKLADYTQHHYSNRLEHCISVSYQSYLLGKKWHLNVRALARAGLLHDLFYYDWRVTKFDLGTHAYIHPRIALRNAEKLTDLSPMEKDIIVKHMWGATTALPKYKESFVVSLVDDYAAMDEVLVPWLQKVRHPFRYHLERS